jgi:hypothetical protein
MEASDRRFGSTEEHRVEEIAGILWRKRRLRLAEAAAHRRGLEGTLASYRETVMVALVHLDTTGQSERAVDAIRATTADTEEDIADMTADEAMTRRALDLLGSNRNDTYEAALAAAIIRQMSGTSRWGKARLRRRLHSGSKPVVHFRGGICYDCSASHFIRRWEGAFVAEKKAIRCEAQGQI